MPSNDLKLLGKRIREVRIQRKISQERLSELCGVGPRHISEMERGIANPSYQVLKAVAGALDVPLCALLDFAHQKDESQLREELIDIIQVLPISKLQDAYRLIFILSE